MFPVPVRISKVNKSENGADKVNWKFEDLEIGTTHRPVIDLE